MEQHGLKRPPSFVKFQTVMTRKGFSIGIALALFFCLVLGFRDSAKDKYEGIVFVVNGLIGAANHALNYPMIWVFIGLIVFYLGQKRRNQPPKKK
jgi:hypothetical protein